MAWLTSLRINSRFYVLCTSVIISLFVFAYVFGVVPSGSIQITKLTQIFALLALLYLYLVLLASPLTRVWMHLPFRGQYLKARRALGISTWYFAVLHASFAFFGELGGFRGLQFLDSTYLFAITLSFISLVILSLMAVTSFDKVVTYLTFPKWKRLHRFVYIAGILTLIHALMLGTQFTDLFGIVPQITFAGLALLLVLEAIAFDRYMQVRAKSWPRFGIAFVSVVSVIIGITIAFFLSIGSNTSGGFSLGIHAGHIQLAKEAQQTANQPIPVTLQNIPGLNGDKTKRYTMSFVHDDQIMPLQDTTLHFQVFDANSGAQITLFNILYEKPVHMIVVDSSLTYFAHIHPEQVGNQFVITTQFPKSDVYHIYLDLQPLGGIEQQFGFTLPVGGGQASSVNTTNDFSTIKQFGSYLVTLSYPKPLQASALAIGEQLFTFHFADAKTRKPITTLHKYLGAYGHLVMINESTYDYLHVHPNALAPAGDVAGGPDVQFLPLGLYGPIKPGIYKLFAQFNPDNQLMVADFAVQVK